MALQSFLPSLSVVIQDVERNSEFNRRLPVLDNAVFGPKEQGMGLMYLLRSDYFLICDVTQVISTVFIRLNMF